jgi:hypothetical protein
VVALHQKITGGAVPLLEPGKGAARGSFLSTAARLPDQMAAQMRAAPGFIEPDPEESRRAVDRGFKARLPGSRWVQDIFWSKG